MTRLSAIDVHCSRCNAHPAAPCTRPNGAPMTDFHQPRWNALGRTRWQVPVGHLTLDVIATPGKVEISGLWLYAGDDTLTMTAAEAAKLADVLREASAVT